MNQSERLASIETLLGERAKVAERDSDRIGKQFEKIIEQLESIQTTVTTNRKDYDQMVNRGWGMIAAVAAAAGTLGAVVKTAIQEWLR